MNAIIRVLDSTDPDMQAVETLLRCGALLCDSKARAERMQHLLDVAVGNSDER